MPVVRKSDEWLSSSRWMAALHPVTALPLFPPVLTQQPSLSPLHHGLHRACAALSFAREKDKLGAYRLDAQYVWCLNHAMLLVLGRYVTEKIPDNILAQMAADPFKVVVTNWALSELTTCSQGGLGDGRHSGSLHE